MSGSRKTATAAAIQWAPNTILTPVLIGVGR
jgi:hypothetical protein